MPFYESQEKKAFYKSYLDHANKSKQQKLDGPVFKIDQSQISVSAANTNSEKEMKKRVQVAKELQEQLCIDQNEESISLDIFKQAEQTFQNFFKRACQMDDNEFKKMELSRQKDVMNQFQLIFEKQFIEKDTEAGVYYPGTFLMEELMKFEALATELYQNAADQFKKFKKIILSLGLTFQKFDKLVDEITELPKTDAKKKSFDSRSNDKKSQKVIGSTYGFSMNKNRKSKNKKTEAAIEQQIDSEKKELTLWRSTLIKIAQLRYSGLKVTMKSYSQVSRSHIDSNFGKYQDPTTEQIEFQNRLSSLKVQVTEKRKLTLKLKPTLKYSQSWQLCLQKYVKRVESIKTKLDKYFGCIERIQTEFDSYRSSNQEGGSDLFEENASQKQRVENLRFFLQFASKFKDPQEMCFYAIGIIENMHKVLPELNQISCDCEERYYYEQNKNTQRIFIDEPMAKDKAAFIDRTTPDQQKWRLKFKFVHFNKYENVLKWDEERQMQLYHPVEEEFSKVHVSGKEFFLQPEFNKEKKCLCFWGINKMMNSKDQLSKAMRTFYIHSNGQKVRFEIACPDDINDLRQYSLYSQSVFPKEKQKMNSIVIEADIVYSKVIERNGFL